MERNEYERLRKERDALVWVLGATELTARTSPTSFR